jgi:hypothetical protein
VPFYAEGKVNEDFALKQCVHNSRRPAKSAKNSPHTFPPLSPSRAETWAP